MFQRFINFLKIRIILTNVWDLVKSKGSPGKHSLFERILIKKERKCFCLQITSKIIVIRGHRTSNIRVRMFDNVRYFLNFEMFDVRMFANIQMFESSNVRMFANIRMFGCSMFECSLIFDCSKVRMFACSLIFEYSNVRCSNVR